MTTSGSPSLFVSFDSHDETQGYQRDRGDGKGYKKKLVCKRGDGSDSRVTNEIQPGQDNDMKLVESFPSSHDQGEKDDLLDRNVAYVRQGEDGQS